MSGTADCSINTTKNIVPDVDVTDRLRLGEPKIAMASLRSFHCSQEPLDMRRKVCGVDKKLIM